MEILNLKDLDIIKGYFKQELHPRARDGKFAKKHEGIVSSVVKEEPKKAPKTSAKIKAKGSTPKKSTKSKATPKKTAGSKVATTKKTTSKKKELVVNVPEVKKAAVKKAVPKKPTPKKFFVYHIGSGTYKEAINAKEVKLKSVKGSFFMEHPDPEHPEDTYIYEATTGTRIVSSYTGEEDAIKHAEIRLSGWGQEYFDTKISDHKAMRGLSPGHKEPKPKASKKPTEASEAAAPKMPPVIDNPTKKRVPKPKVVSLPKTSNSESSDLVPDYQNKGRVRVVARRIGSYAVPNMQVNSREDVAQVFADLTDSDREKSYVMGTKDGEVVGIHCAHIGNVDSSIIDPKDMMKVPLLSGADTVYLIHNHPTGDSTPSQPDVAVTERFRDVADHMGMRFGGHVVIGDNEYTALNGNGSIVEFNKNMDRSKIMRTKQAPVYETYQEKDASVPGPRMNGVDDVKAYIKSNLSIHDADKSIYIIGVDTKNGITHAEPLDVTLPPDKLRKKALESLIKANSKSFFMYTGLGSSEVLHNAGIQGASKTLNIQLYDVIVPNTNSRQDIDAGHWAFRSYAERSIMSVVKGLYIDLQKALAPGKVTKTQAKSLHKDLPPGGVWRSMNGHHIYILNGKVLAGAIPGVKSAKKATKAHLAEHQETIDKEAKAAADAARKAKKSTSSKAKPKTGKEAIEDTLKGANNKESSTKRTKVTPEFMAKQKKDVDALAKKPKAKSKKATLEEQQKAAHEMLGTKPAKAKAKAKPIEDPKDIMSMIPDASSFTQSKEDLGQAWKLPWSKYAEALKKRNANFNLNLESFKSQHKRLVSKALDEGQKVPKAVLDEYPDLKPKKTKKGEVADIRTEAQVNKTTARDVGQKVWGSKKDKASLRAEFAEKPTMQGLEALEEVAPEVAQTLCVKKNILAPVDFKAEMERGVDVNVAMLKQLIYDRIAAKPPEDTPVARAHYMRAINELQRLLEPHKTQEEFDGAYSYLRNYMKTEDPKYLKNQQGILHYQERDLRDGPSQYDLRTSRRNPKTGEREPVDLTPEQWRAEKQARIDEIKASIAMSETLAKKPFFPLGEKLTKYFTDHESKARTNQTLRDKKLTWAKYFGSKETKKLTDEEKSQQYYRKESTKGTKFELAKDATPIDIAPNIEAFHYVDANGKHFIHEVKTGIPLSSAYGRATKEEAIAGAKRYVESNGSRLDSWLKNQVATGKVSPRFAKEKKESGTAEKWEKVMPEKIQRIGGRKTSVQKPEDMAKTFGFRGVEFGHYVDDKSGSFHLVKSAEAMHDLADLLGLEDKDISLNGKLAMAFGARGGGWGLAHYEPDMKVINITKNGGAGSLGHEWGHAMDNILYQYMTGKASTNLASDDKGVFSESSSPELASAYRSLMQAIKVGDGKGKEAIHNQNLEYSSYPRSWKTAYDTLGLDKAIEEVTKTMKTRKDINSAVQVMAYLHKKATGEAPDTLMVSTGRSQYYLDSLRVGGLKENSYWVRPHELFARAFETHLQLKMEQSKKIHNDYLVYGAKGVDPGSPYPRGEEAVAISKAFDNLMDVVKREKAIQKGLSFDLQKGIIRRSDLQRPVIPSIRSAYQVDGSSFDNPIDEILYIPTNRLQTPFQTDKALDFDKVRSLVTRMEDGSLIAPIIIGWNYEVHDGHHKLEASKIRNYTHCPCIIGEFNDIDKQRLFEEYSELWKSLKDDIATTDLDGEKKAILDYSERLKQIKDPKIRKVIAEIIADEKNHEHNLKKVLAYMAGNEGALDDLQKSLVYLPEVDTGLSAFPYDNAPGVMFRGIGQKEYDFIQKSGYIQTKGKGNDGDQENVVTCFSTLFSQAEGYARSNYDLYHEKQAYVLAVEYQGTENELGEIEVLGKIPASSIVGVVLVPKTPIVKGLYIDLQKSITRSEAKGVHKDLPEGGVWRTMSGHHVYIKDGKILAGSVPGAKGAKKATKSHLAEHQKTVDKEAKKPVVHKSEKPMYDKAKGEGTSKTKGVDAKMGERLSATNAKKLMGEYGVPAGHREAILQTLKHSTTSNSFSAQGRDELDATGSKEVIGREYSAVDVQKAVEAYKKDKKFTKDIAAKAVAINEAAKRAKRAKADAKAQKEREHEEFLGKVKANTEQMYKDQEAREARKNRTPEQIAADEKAFADFDPLELLMAGTEPKKEPWEMTPDEYFHDKMIKMGYMKGAQGEYVGVIHDRYREHLAGSASLVQQKEWSDQEHKKLVLKHHAETTSMADAFKEFMDANKPKEEPKKEEPKISQYYKSNKSVGDHTGKLTYVPVDGKRVDVGAGVHAFIHKGAGDQRWVVTEAQTGLSLAEGKTRESAIQEATRRTAEHGVTKLVEYIKSHIEKHGESPATAEPGKAGVIFGSEPEETPYHIAVPKGKSGKVKYMPVYEHAEKVNVGKGVHAFIHGKDGEWVVSEARSGLKITSDSSKNLAIKVAKDLIERNKGNINAMIQKHIEKHGESPKTAPTFDEYVKKEVKGSTDHLSAEAWGSYRRSYDSIYNGKR